MRLVVQSGLLFWKRARPDSPPAAAAAASKTLQAASVGGRFGTETHNHKHYPERLISRNSTRQPRPGGIEVFWDENQKQSDNQRVWKEIKRFSSLVNGTLGIIDLQP